MDLLYFYELLSKFLATRVDEPVLSIYIKADNLVVEVRGMKDGKRVASSFSIDWSQIEHATEDYEDYEDQLMTRLIKSFDKPISGTSERPA